MRKVFLLCLAAAVGVAPSWSQEGSKPAFWKGKYAVYQFNLGGAVAVGGEAEGRVIHAGTVWESDYDLYQNPQGVARLELTHMNRNRSVEGPLDIQLLDYRQGMGWIWDKGGNQATKGPLGPRAAGMTLGTRQILGFTCEGNNYEWTTWQNATMQLQSWSAQDTNFRVPLLRVRYVTDSAGVLSALIIQVVTQAERISDLPASLFEVPAGLRVVAVRSIE